MKFEFRRKLLHEDIDARLRVFIDPDCTQANAATVTILDDELTVYPVNGEQWSYERLMAEAQRTAAWLRTQPFGKAHPHPGVLYPFAEILLTDRERIFARGRLQVGCIVGHVGEDNHTYAKHTARDAERAMERVRALGECVDMLAYLQKKRAAK